MLPVVFAVASLMDLEYRQVVAQAVLSGQPVPPSTRAWYRMRGRVLSAFIRDGMSREEVRRVLGVGPSVWTQVGEE